MNLTKLFALALLTSTAGAFAAPNCYDFNVALQVGLDATKGLIALADVPDVEEYQGGVLEGDREKTLLTIEAYYRFSKDWYQIIVRNADCRVLATELRGEGLNLNRPANTKLNSL